MILISNAGSSGLVEKHKSVAADFLQPVYSFAVLGKLCKTHKQNQRNHFLALEFSRLKCRFFGVNMKEQNNI